VSTASAILFGTLLAIWGLQDTYACEPKTSKNQQYLHSREIVPQEYLTNNSYWGTLIEGRTAIVMEFRDLETTEEV
jgi:hypothetical protein